MVKLIVSVPIIKSEQRPHGVAYASKQMNRTAEKKALQFDTTHLLAILQSVPDAIVTINSRCEIVLWNTAAARMFGYTAEEALGQDVSIIMPPATADAHRRQIRRVLHGEPSRLVGTTVELVGQRKNGAEFPVELSLAMWQADRDTFFSASIRDISHRKHTQSVTRYYEFIVNTSNQLMTFIDRNHRYVAVSDAYCIAHNKPRDSLVGKTVSQVWGQEIYRQAIKPQLDRVFGSGETFQFQDWVQFHTLGKRFVEVSYSPYYGEPERVTHAVVVTQDVTDFKHAQMALEENIRQAELAYQQAITYAESLKTEVAERKHVEKLLQQLLAENNSLLEAIPLILIGLDADAVITHWNAPAENTFGISGTQMVGKPFRTAGISWNWNTIEVAIAACLSSRAAVRLTEVAYTRPDGTPGYLNITLNQFHRDIAGLTGVLLLAEDITEHRAAQEAQRMLETVVQQTAESVVITDPTGTITYVNPAFEQTTGYTTAEVLGENPRILKSDRQDAAFYRELWATITAGKVWRGRIVNRRKDGSLFTEDAAISPIFDERGKIVSYVAIKHDVTRRLHLEAQQRQMQKMEAIGQLAAGIAHEINTPTQFIGDNIGFLETACSRVERLLATYRSLAEAVEKGNTTPAMIANLKAMEKKLRLDYLRREIPMAIEEAAEGVDRVANIVKAMKEFSHPGVQEKTLTDINRAIESTITVSRNEWKYVAEVVTDFDPDLPLVLCLPGELNQAILNIIVNAAHAIANVVDREAGEKGQITISTHVVENWVEIRISDTGSGIAPEHQPHIFEPFFTTKEVGVGTGQGLAITYHIIVEKHGGTISFETAVGEGTTFTIRLPLLLPDVEE